MKYKDWQFHQRKSSWWKFSWKNYKIRNKSGYSKGRYEEIQRKVSQFSLNLIYLRLREINFNYEKLQHPSELDFPAQVKHCEEVIEKIKKDILNEVFDAQKDIDTLKSSKLNSVEFYEFRNLWQGIMAKFENLNFLPEAVRAIGKISSKELKFRG